MLDYMAEISVTGGRGIRVDRKVNGTFLTADIPRVEPAAEPGVVTQYRLKSVGDDVLSCVEFDGTSEGEAVTIAKPYKLRKTPFHNAPFGHTYILEGYPGAPAQIIVFYNYISGEYRIATSGNLTEHQVIIPRYSLNDIIYATASSNGTATSADLVDLNADGRAWARVS